MILKPYNSLQEMKADVTKRMYDTNENKIILIAETLVKTLLTCGSDGNVLTLPQSVIATISSYFKTAWDSNLTDFSLQKVKKGVYNGEDYGELLKMLAKATDAQELEILLIDCKPIKNKMADFKRKEEYSEYYENIMLVNRYHTNGMVLNQLEKFSHKKYECEFDNTFAPCKDVE